MLDINSKEIFLDDEVILSRGAGVCKAKFIKETKCQYHFSVPWLPHKDYVFYTNKGSGNASFYKI